MTRGLPVTSPSTVHASEIGGFSDGGARRSGGAAHERDAASLSRAAEPGFSPMRFHVCGEDWEAASVMEEVRSLFGLFESRRSRLNVDPNRKGDIAPCNRRTHVAAGCGV